MRQAKGWRHSFDAAKIKGADCLHNSGLWNGTIECQDQRDRNGDDDDDDGDGNGVGSGDADQQLVKQPNKQKWN